MTSGLCHIRGMYGRRGASQVQTLVVYDHPSPYIREEGVFQDTLDGLLL